MIGQLSACANVDVLANKAERGKDTKGERQTKERHPTEPSREREIETHVEAQREEERGETHADSHREMRKEEEEEKGPAICRTYTCITGHVVRMRLPAVTVDDLSGHDGRQLLPVFLVPWHRSPQQDHVLHDTSAT